MYNFYLDKRVPLPPSSRIRKLLLIMKLTTLILITVILHVSAASMAQKVTLKTRNAALTDIFDQIRTQTGYDFALTTDALKDAKPVTIDVKNEELKDALTEILKGQNLDFSLDNKIVVIKPKETAFIDNLKNKITEAITNIDVQGRVVDETGQPLAGATIRQKNGNAATITDANGTFTLKNLDPATVITISFIGYSPLELKVKAEMGTIRMVKSSDKLDEVRVIAYGQTTQRLSTGNETHITAETIDKQPVTNVLAAIEGRVPGLFIQQQSGLPGAGFTAQIRGQASINNSSNPLVVIDGMPYIPSVSINGNASGGNTTGIPLNFINMNDIESVDVLKDADATAIYGSRGANGVILITTKKGKAGKTKVDASITAGFSQKPMLTFLNTTQYLQMRNEAYSNDGITTLPANAYDINGTWDKNSYTDWQKLLVGNTAHYTDAELSISGGDVNTQYLIGGSFNRQTTTFPTGFPDQTAGLHFNIASHSANNKFKISLTGSYTNNLNTSIQSDIANNINLAPDAPSPYNSAGTLNWANSTFPNGNPLAALYMPDVLSVNNIISSSTISYQLLPGLEVKSTMGYNFTSVYEHGSNPISAQDPAFNPVNSASFNNTNYNSYTVEPQLTYLKIWGRGVLSSVIGSSIQQLTSNQTTITASNYPSDAQLQSPTGAGSASARGTFSQYKYAALFARINYNYDDTYIFNFAGRRDGSSRFGPGKQYANFGSVAGAWVFTKEDWLNVPTFLSFGKLRASYGLTGNDQIGDYKYLNLYKATATTATYQNTVGLFPSSLNNPDYAWETNTKLEFGLDLGFLKNRINLSADYYRQRSSNQLAGAPLPSFVGPGSVTINLPAVLQNQGFDLMISSTNIHSNSFSWTSNFNVSLNRNTLVSYPNLATSGLSSIYTIGKTISGTYLFHSVGVNPATGLYQFTDSNGNLTYAPSQSTDRTVFFDPTPKYYGGLDNSFHYKGFELSFFLQFTQQKGKNLAYFSNNGVPEGYVGYNVLSSVWTNTWHQPGDNARYEKVTTSTNSAAYAAYNYAASSDFFNIDASYIRLKTMALHYTLPSKFLNKLHVTNLQIYVEGQNLYTFTGLHADPTISYLTTPLLRTFVTGLQITL